MSKKKAAKQSGGSAVWRDEDDFNASVSIPKVKKSFAHDIKGGKDGASEVDSEVYVKRLRAAFQKRHTSGTPKWAQVKRRKLEDDEDFLSKSAEGYIEKDTFLPKTTIATTLIRDFNVGHRSKKPINVVRFHKKRQVLITADEGGTVQLFKVSSEVNTDNFLQCAQFTKFPIGQMELCNFGQSVMCSSSRQQYFLSYDMEQGSVSQLRFPKSIAKQGVRNFALSSDGQLLALGGTNCHVYVLAAATMEHVKTISLPSNSTSLQFFPSSNSEIWIMTESGQVVICETRGPSQHTFIDDGAVHGTKIAISNHGDYIATGSDTGIVNVYDGSVRSEKEPKPIFTVQNLTTAVSAIAFSSDAQMVAVASSVKKNQLRIVHLRSKSVFQNFPTRHGKVTTAKCVEFSPNSGYMAVGCEDGKLQVNRIDHFPSY